MVQILIESTTGQVVSHRQSGSHSRAQHRAAAFGVVQFWPLHSSSTSFVVVAGAFTLGFACGILTVVYLIFLPPNLTCGA